MNNKLAEDIQKVAKYGMENQKKPTRPEDRAKEIMELHWPNFKNHKGVSTPTFFMMPEAAAYWWRNKLEFPEAEEFRQIYADRIAGRILF